MNCQDLTQTIAQITKLKLELDLALEQKDLPAGRESQKKLEEALSAIETFGLTLKNWFLLAKRVGGIKELLNRIDTLEIGGKTAAELEQELLAKNINISDDALDMLHSSEFTTLPEKQKIHTVRLKVRDLFGDNRSHNYDQITARARELGLYLLPYETAANLPLKEETQPKRGKSFKVASKAVADRYGNPRVFTVDRYDDGLWLSYFWADLRNRWDFDRELMFRLRNVSQES